MSKKTEPVVADITVQDWRDDPVVANQRMNDASNAAMSFSAAEFGIVVIGQLLWNVASNAIAKNPGNPYGGILSAATGLLGKFLNKGK